MSAHVKQERKPIKPTGDWVKARRVAELFDVSEGAVYHGEGGLGGLRSTYISGHGKRPARRWYWPDAVALSERMLAEASRASQPLPLPISHLLDQRRRRGAA